MRISIPYGNAEVAVQIPRENLIGIVATQDPPREDIEEAAIRKALCDPIGTEPLRKLAGRGDTVSIVVNDITRPFLGERLLPPVLHELREAGVQNRDITVLIATGVHRANTLEEQRLLLGHLPDDIKVVNHDPRDEANLVQVGTTRRGTPVIIHRTYVESKVRILTGLISPHQQAGFSGGRKSILPGLASEDSVRTFHSFPICPRNVAVGRIEGNPTHEESLEAARIAGVDFIVNAVPNSRGEVFQVVAGHFHEAWMEGVEIWKQKLQVEVPEYADVTIVSPGGYPRDINFWQAQKAIASAELITRKSGIIILVARCSEGLGEDRLRWFEWLTQASSPNEVIARFEREGYVGGSSKAFLFARALQNHRIMVVSDALEETLLKQMFFEKHCTVQEALNSALAIVGKAARIGVVPRAVECLPSVPFANGRQVESLARQFSSDGSSRGAHEE